jgi:hypothetical protein
MKTTLEIPDPVFRKAKARAAERGIPLRQFVTEAVEEKLKATTETMDKPWMQMAGGLRHLRKETARIMALIEDEFETIDPEDSK